jgi:dynein heavy chain 1
VLSAQISWSESVEAGLKQLEATPALADSADTHPLQLLLRSVEQTLKLLADSVLHDQAAIRRRKLEHLIIEHVHQRDVLRELLARGVRSSRSFDWLCQMRFYFDPKVSGVHTYRASRKKRRELN